jgi:hypothetical protein
MGTEELINPAWQPLEGQQSVAAREARDLSKIARRD